MTRSTNAPLRPSAYPVCVSHPFDRFEAPIYPVRVAGKILAAIGRCPGCGGRLVYKSFERLIEGPLNGFEHRNPNDTRQGVGDA